MKILWFTNIPMPGMVGKQNSRHAESGGWMIALLEQLTRVPGVEISVACAAPGLLDGEVASEEKIRFYTISQGKGWRLFCFKSLDNDPRYLDACAQVVRQVDPDVIHVHGTERFYGLLGARGLVSAPVVISLQGLLHDYVRYRQYFGVTPLRDIIASQRLLNLFRGLGTAFEYRQSVGAARREIEILKGNRWFMGRTTWDRAHLHAVNSRARYFHVPELMRSTFHETRWDLASCTRNRIIFTNANCFRRGTEVVLEALSILKRENPDTKLALAGAVDRNRYGRPLLSRVHDMGLGDVVELLGKINEKQMAGELCKAHVFAITSLVENSPNSLCEAQLIGMPCVASYAGGIPSLVEEGQTGLCFPAGDAAVLARRIGQIFTDDDLARRLGARARESAMRRHDPDTVTRRVLAAYETVIREAKNPQHSARSGERG